ncbi:variable surface protein, partial [Plasmodium gonderi]
MAQPKPETFKITDLPSSKFYDMLDKDSLSLEKSNVIFCSRLSRTFDNFDKIKKLCSKYITYLRKQNNIWKKYGYNDKNCKLLSYWVSQELLGTLKIDKNKCNEVFAQIEVMWSYASNVTGEHISYKCTPYSYIFFFYSNWENAKVLYDYYVDFDYLKSIPDGCGDNCIDLCEYLKKIDNAYKSFKTFCSYKQESICPLYDIDYKAYDPELLLKNFKCHTSSPVLDSVIQDLSKVEQEVPPDGKEASSILISTEDSQEKSELLNEKPKTIGTFGNSLLGLVLTSMLFALLY